MKKHMMFLIVVAALVSPLWAQQLESLPSDPYFATYKPVKAPAVQGLLLKPGDRLAICGDSITEQKMYSRIMETYLTVCVPQLGVTVRQFGWSGEQARGFLARMENDVLRFKPTIATTCYGMNDHGYQPYQADLGKTYREASCRSRPHVQRPRRAGDPGLRRHRGQDARLGQAGPRRRRGPQPQSG